MRSHVDLGARILVEMNHDDLVHPREIASHP
jgi:hypothetical protein